MEHKWLYAPEWVGKRLSFVTAGVMTAVCVLWAVDLPVYFGKAFFKEQFLAIVLGLGIASVFLTRRWNGKSGGPLPLFDLFLAMLGLVTLLYASYDYPRLLDAVAFRPPELVAIGTIVVVLVMEGLRRATGWVLFGLIGMFLVYAPFAYLAPGDFVGRKVGLAQLLQYIGFDPSAVFGTPLAVASSIVVMFILMGKLLFKAGGGDFFTDLAQGTTGRTRGGSAKIAVVASALFGSISGSAVSNVASTGVITIPLMRKSGYRAVDAGAIEAVASTGGQLMPPIMGAAAFLMAEFLEIPYASVMTAAFFPAVLYYFAIFLQVDLMAAKSAIRNAEQDLPGPMRVLAEGWHFILPIVVLLYALFWQNAEPEVAALWSSLVIVAAGFIKPYKGRRLSLKDVVSTLWETGLATIELILIVAAAGFVIGILNITGLGFGLTLFLVNVAGEQLWILLVIAAAVCILLGMGMPTSGVYVLLATLVGPAIIEAGVEPLAAHMFILYFGMMSMITPPIALAAFAAAAITQKSALETGIAAMRFGWVAYIVPFLFIYSPSLLMFGETAEIALELVTVTLGVSIITIALVGFYRRPVPIPARAVLVIAGLGTMTPVHATSAGAVVNVVCGGFGILWLAWELVHSRKVARSAAG